MKKALLAGVVVISLFLLIWFPSVNSTYNYRDDGARGDKSDMQPEAREVANASPLTSEQSSSSNFQDLIDDDIPKHVKACIRFWADMKWDYAKAIVDESDGKVKCVIEVNSFTKIPNREAYSVLELEAKSLGVPVASLTPNDIIRVFSWKYDPKKHDVLREIIWQNRFDCIDNPHQSICRLSPDDPSLPDLDKMPSDFKVPGFSE